MEGIVTQVENAGKSNMQNIIKVSKEQAVSSDFGGDTFSCILDLDSSLQLTPNFFKLICWYENEYSYACRVIDTIFFLERQYQIEWTSNISYIRPTPKHSVIQTNDSNNKFTYHQACSYECHNSKSLRSSSQDSGFKSPKRPSIARKPLPVRNYGTKKLTCLNRDTKKTNELFKIWNDEDDTIKEPMRRQNRSSFFHSCVALTPQLNTNAPIKTRERLENVKREFSKMVIMTENLLKQSNHSKIKIGSPDISSNDLNNSTGDKVPASDETELLSEKAFYISAVKPDFKNEENKEENKLSGVKNCYETSTRAHDDKVKDVDEDHNDPILIDNDVKIDKNKPSMDGDIVNNGHNIEICNTNYQRTYSFEKLKNKIFNFNLTLTNDNESIANCASSNGYNANHESILLNSKQFKTTETIKIVSNNDIMTIDSLKCYSKEANNSQNLAGNTTLFDKHDQGDIKNCEKDKCVQDDYLKQQQIVSSEVLKQNVLVRSNLLNIEENNTSEGIDSNKCEAENIDSQDQQGRNLQLRLQGVLKKLAIDSNVSEKPSTCLSSINTITTASNRDIKQKQDIYDKLDSVSATDSENSFNMKERKSQVIHITDLTNSLEDLDRLDKICRIMEISDELSDQLLSPLNNDDCKELKNKKWSFKDLCERIKLDEFCNKIFNKSYS